MAAERNVTTSRNNWYFVAIILLLIAVVLTVVQSLNPDYYVVKRNKVYDFNYIVHGHVSEVVNAKTDDSSEVDWKTLLDNYSSGEFVLWTGSVGSTTQRKISFVDENDKVLFVITDIGNQNLIRVRVDGTLYTYQQK